MAQYTNREGRGNLFRSNDKNPHPMAPGHRGGCKIGGVEYHISAWVETAKSGMKYMSLKFDRKEDQPHDDQDAADQPDHQGPLPDTHPEPF